MSGSKRKVPHGADALRQFQPDQGTEFRIRDGLMQASRAHSAVVVLQGLEHDPTPGRHGSSFLRAHARRRPSTCGVRLAAVRGDLRRHWGHCRVHFARARSQVSSSSWTCAALDADYVQCSSSRSGTAGRALAPYQADKLGRGAARASLQAVQSDQGVGYRAALLVIVGGGWRRACKADAPSRGPVKKKTLDPAEPTLADKPGMVDDGLCRPRRRFDTIVRSDR